MLPATVQDLSYDALDGVANSGQAVAAYQEAIHPTTPPDRKTLIEAQLHAYCHLDTLALVRIWKLFSGAHAVCAVELTARNSTAVLTDIPVHEPHRDPLRHLRLQTRHHRSPLFFNACASEGLAG